MEPQPEPEFDALVELARSALGCEMAALSFIDDEGQRQVFKAQAGLPAQLSDERQTSLALSYCVHARDADSILEITDARRSNQFEMHPALTELGFVAYLGCPVHGPARDPVGVICVISRTPRIWSARDRENIARLARLTSTQILLRAAMSTVKILAKAREGVTTGQKRTAPLQHEG
ncbi:GAF domain-containing protein [Halovulum dunhuangense]|uniref:GAF domain-containing protein n=1 Tax=Halovulum dunhuangense TaxID=1505036 RepID=A0A849L0R2_9RHOB|nr:GAF domain-containing protein [Halovulum dunhuangense]NNU79835.1 GAF domain-containing protein [Halovulum dunhuangense]